MVEHLALNRSNFTAKPDTGSSEQAAVLPMAGLTALLAVRSGLAANGGTHLTELATLVKDGRVRPVIDRRYPFPELPAALRYQEAGHAPGKVIVTR